MKKRSKMIILSDKKINTLTYYAKNGMWLSVGEIIYNHLELTNFKICIHNPAYDSWPWENQKLYDVALNNLIYIYDIPFNHDQKYKLFLFWLKQAQGYIYD